MQLKIQLNNENSADGIYSVTAEDCIAASLYWADENGPLPEWTSFASFPIPPHGTGVFEFQGERAIPEEASHVFVRGIHSALLTKEDALEPLEKWEMKAGAEKLPEKLSEKPPEEPSEEPELRFAVMSDLHMTRKTGRLLHALERMEKADALLFPGDLVNDGRIDQFQLLKECLESRVPAIPIAAASGNHDYPINPVPRIWEEVCDYPAFQDWLTKRNRKLGCQVENYPHGVSVISFGNADVISLNAATHKRRFLFREGEQIAWLRSYLEESGTKRHIIICHAPLFAHNPQRKKGKGAPYLSRDRELQEILDSHKGIIFISGHTHLSPNQETGCVEYDRQHGNLYINDGSLCPTELKDSGAQAPAEWGDGNVFYLGIKGNQVTLSAVLIHSGKKIPRGFYRFTME